MLFWFSTNTQLYMLSESSRRNSEMILVATFFFCTFDMKFQEI